MRFLKETMETEGTGGKIDSVNSRGPADLGGVAVKGDDEDDEVQIVMENIKRKRVTSDGRSPS
jgi:hypothetical protein